ncbi:MAG: phospholipid carrier-dependent glycosyltransferase [Chloroflexi bacterium]|nr:phospholipid carrier-dependent glycosyltransferase [Chloroflexota bacterium]
MFGYRRAAVNGPAITPVSQSNACSGHSAGRLPWSPWRLVREVGLLLLVLAAAAVVLRGPAVRQGFTIDESRWIATSRYYWITFVDRDLFGPAWQPNYIVLTHPPVARYLIGLGLALQDWTPEQLNGRYDSLQSRAFNERAGNVPQADLLAAARRVTFLFGVAAVGLLYGIARLLGGPLSGLATVALALVNPLLTTIWTRALAESIVATFTLLTLLLALTVLPRVAGLRRLAWTPLTVGASLALATAAKLNGAMGAVGLVLFALVQQGLAIRATGRTAGLRSWVDLALAAVILFVIANPLLYLKPVERAWALVEHRQDEMQFQRQVFSDQAVPPDLIARVERVGRRAFGSWGTPGVVTPIAADALLVPVGVALLAWRAFRSLRRGTAGRELLLLCWSLATYVIVTVNLGFDSSHYYAPIVSLNMILGGIAIGAAVALARRRIGDRRAAVS